MIEYSFTKVFSKKQLKKLFLSVKWESAAYPDKLQKAMPGFSKVITAWDGDELVGLICAMDDGVMTAYIHYLLVDPRYQGLGIGAELVSRIKELYKDYLSIVIIVYKDKTGFYEKCGFIREDDAALPMIITKL